MNSTLRHGLVSIGVFVLLVALLGGIDKLQSCARDDARTSIRPEPLPQTIQHDGAIVMARACSFFTQLSQGDDVTPACSFRTEPPICWAVVSGQLDVAICDEDECRPQGCGR